MGHFYECRQDYQQALQWTQKALWASDQKLMSPDSLYLWEWQTGRILHGKGKKVEALAAYERAYTILEQIRSDILSADRDLQLDFREIIEPLYRQLAQLKLELAPLDRNTKQQSLTQAVEIIDSLKLAELQTILEMIVF